MLSRCRTCEGRPEMSRVGLCRLHPLLHALHTAGIAMTSDVPQVTSIAAGTHLFTKRFQGRLHEFSFHCVLQGDQDLQQHSSCVWTNASGQPSGLTRSVSMCQACSRSVSICLLATPGTSQPIHPFEPQRLLQIISGKGRRICCIED